MDETAQIKQFGKLQRLISLFQRINQLSWTSDQTRKRYPAPETMTSAEVEALLRVFLALGMDIEEIYKEWRKEYLEYKNEK